MPCPGRLSDIGVTSGQVLTAMPLPLLLLWAQLCVSAHRQGCERVHNEALQVLLDHYVQSTAAQDLWVQSPMDATTLRLARQTCVG